MLRTSVTIQFSLSNSFPCRRWNWRFPTKWAYWSFDVLNTSEGQNSFRRSWLLDGAPQKTFFGLGNWKFPNIGFDFNLTFFVLTCLWSSISCSTLIGFLMSWFRRFGTLVKILSFGTISTATAYYLTSWCWRKMLTWWDIIGCLSVSTLLLQHKVVCIPNCTKNNKIKNFLSIFTI